MVGWLVGWSAGRSFGNNLLKRREVTLPRSYFLGSSYLLFMRLVMTYTKGIKDINMDKMVTTVFIKKTLYLHLTLFLLLKHDSSININYFYYLYSNKSRQSHADALPAVEGVSVTCDSAKLGKQGRL